MLTDGKKSLVTKLWVLVGTKAEYIKLASLLKALDYAPIKYTLIEIGQHYPLTDSIRDEFVLRKPDIVIRPMPYKYGLMGKLMWLIRILIDIIIATPSKYGIDGSSQKLAIIQGDTVSTLAAMLLSKKLGFKLAHIEAGLTSRSLFNPIPEEFIRRIVSKYSDMLFAPSEEALSNLRKYAHSKSLFLTHGNTGLDSCLEIFKIIDVPEKSNSRRTLLVAIHRLENLYIPNKLRTIIKVLLLLTEEFDIVMINYENTLNRIKQFRLGKLFLEKKNVNIIPHQGYGNFIINMLSSSCVITDGGTIQEECFYLGIACAILRDRTERPYCLNAKMAIYSPRGRNIPDIIKWIKNHVEFGDCLERTNTCPNDKLIRNIKDNLQLSSTEIVMNVLVYNGKCWQ